MLGAALKLLEITHGTNHGMYKDGLDMINICLQGEYIFSNDQKLTLFLERHMDKEALMRVRAARQRMGEGKEIDMEQHMGHGPIQWKKNFQNFQAIPVHLLSDKTNTCTLEAFKINK